MKAASADATELNTNKKRVRKNKSFRRKEKRMRLQRLEELLRPMGAVGGDQPGAMEGKASASSESNVEGDFWAPGSVCRPFV